MLGDKRLGDCFGNFQASLREGLSNLYEMSNEAFLGLMKGKSGLIGIKRHQDSLFKRGQAWRILGLLGKRLSE